MGSILLQSQINRKISAKGCQASLTMGFSRQGYWSGLPFPSPEDLPDPGIEPVSLAASALAGGVFNTAPSGLK